MDIKHRQIIHDNLGSLVEVTNRLDDIIEELVGRKILNTCMMRHLAKYHHPKLQLEEFYMMMLGRGPAAFDMLIAVLRATDNFRAEQLLSSYKVCAYTATIENVIADPAPADELDNVEDSELKVTAHPDRKWMDIENEYPNGVYRMRSKPRGYALIINIRNYDDSRFNVRNGSECDARSLEKLFQQFGYVVTPYSDLTGEEMKSRIRAFSKNWKLRDVDSLIVFIMCHGVQLHGTSVDLIGRDTISVNSAKVIDEFLDSPINRPGQRKPKIFFFVACRANPSFRKINHILVNENTDADTVPDAAAMSNNEPTEYRRIHEDFIQVFSTISGYESYRNSSKGTYFVQELCDVFSKHAWEWDLDTLLGRVDTLMREKKLNQGHEIVKQSSTQRVFFNPGLYEE